MNGLTECYEKLSQVLEMTASGQPIESLAVVQKVEEYREYWRPQEVRLLLLAESHRYTTDVDLNCRLDQTKLGLPSYPSNFVRFVYCLGYGEPELLLKPPHRNPGTKDYWKIFYSCLNNVTSHDDCSAVLKTKTKSFSKRIMNKVDLLKQMKREGVWLVDASIIGIDGEFKPGSDGYGAVIETCWDHYIGQMIAKTNPSHVLIIGSMVRSVLLSKIRSLVGNRHTEIPQPAAFLTAKQRIDMLNKCHMAYLSSRG